MNRFLRKRESIIIAICVIVSILAYILLHSVFSGNDVVALVTYDSKPVMTINLDKDEIYHIEAIYPVTLEVKDKAISFINSQCPNHDCEGFGYISNLYESAICLPARVSVQIINRAGEHSLVE